MTITVFEHEILLAGRGERNLSPEQLLSLQRFCGNKTVPYYSLINNGVQFCEYVGVIKIGDLTIEVLPKADKNNDKESWKKVLVGMLQTVGFFDIHAPSAAGLNLRSNSILDLYFQWFIKEVEQLLHKGLVKKYRKVNNNCYALKGKLEFGKHIQKNIVHQEKFYVRYTLYDNDHSLNAVLLKTLKLLKRINPYVELQSRLGNLILNFPELADIRTDEPFFDKIVYNRKTEHYKKAIDIAELLLLNYHPDINKGKKDVLALMFDMNLLWEKFVYVSLKRSKNLWFKVEPQVTRDFWKPTKGRKSIIKPDIVISRDKSYHVILDTKWKNLNGSNPSADDLKQLYVYSKFHNDSNAALVYPGETSGYKSGKFINESGIESRRECGVFIIQVIRDIKEWQKEIAKQLLRFQANALMHESHTKQGN